MNNTDTQTAQPSALDRTRAVAGDAARRTAETIETNPLGIIVGGLAVGVLAGALLPRTDKEKELLAPVGKRLGGSVATAISNIREQGQNELQTRGFTADAAQEQVKNLLGGLGKVVSGAVAGAAKSATGGQADAGQGGQNQGASTDGGQQGGSASV